MVAGDPLTTSVAAVVSKDGGHPKGTAFFLGPDVALTCSHVIRELGPDAIRLVLVPHDQLDGQAVVKFDDPPTIDVVDVDDDTNLDLALLRVHHQPDVGWLPLSVDWTLGDDVFSRGYHKPVGTYPGGDAVNGKIVGLGLVGFRGRQSQLLTLEDIAVERGISGGPLVHRLHGGVDAVLGVIRIRAGAERAHAIPAETVLARWPGLASVAQGDPDPGPEPQFEQLVESGGPTLDGGYERSIPSFAWTSAEQVADEGLNDVVANRVVSVPGVQYKAIVAASTVTPPFLKRALTRVAQRFD